MLLVCCLTDNFSFVRNTNQRVEFENQILKHLQCHHNPQKIRDRTSMARPKIQVQNVTLFIGDFPVLRM